MATNCTTCPGGEEREVSSDASAGGPVSYKCPSGSSSGFSIFDHPWWLALIGLFLIAVVVAAYFMFRTKEGSDDHEYQMSD